MRIAYSANVVGAVLVTGKMAKLSSIFDWYAADFKASGGAVAFLNKHRTHPIPADAKVSYFDYDWSLNEARYR